MLAFCWVGLGAVCCSFCVGAVGVEALGDYVGICFVGHGELNAMAVGAVSVNL